MAYKHGLYTEKMSNEGNLVTKAQGTIPVYIGTAPNGVTEFKPVLINSFKQAEETIGYSDDWEKNTLCEAVYAHFMNTKRPVAPIVVIVANVVGDSDVSDAFEFSRFEEILSALDNVEQICGVVPNIISVPSADVSNNEIMSELSTYCARGIANKWGVVAYIDMPSTVGSVSDAISRQSAEAINVENRKVRLHFPAVKHNGKVFHLSVLDCVASQWKDTETDGVPCRSTSNTAVDCDLPYANGNPLYFSEYDANRLNEIGITTINYIGGEYRLWGGHMSNYRAAKADTIDPQDKSDATVRADVFLHNWLKSAFIDNIDFPVSRRDIDGIVANVNIALNSFVKNGYLLKGECYFNADNNPTAELAEGDITLDVQYTSVPNGKSITFAVQYTTEGLENIVAVEEEQEA